MVAKAFRMAGPSRRAAREPQAAADAKMAGSRPLTAADVRAPGADREPLRRVAAPRPPASGGINP